MSDEETDDVAKCPKCGNPYAHADLGLGTVHCRECGYTTPEGQVDI